MSAVQIPEEYEFVTSHRHCACIHTYIPVSELPYWQIYRRIPKIWRILNVFGHRYFGIAIWRNVDFLKAFGSKFFFWRNILTYHFLQSILSKSASVLISRRLCSPDCKAPL